MTVKSVKPFFFQVNQMNEIKKNKKNYDILLWDRDNSHEQLPFANSLLKKKKRGFHLGDIPD